MKTGEVFQSTLGTPMYRAPEMFSSDGYTDQIDLYATGIMLYIMTYGDYARNEYGNIVFHSKGKERETIVFPSNDKIDPKLIDLIKQLTQYDCNKRLTWEQFYLHPFVQQLNPKELRFPTPQEFSLNNSKTLSSSAENDSNSDDDDSLFDF